MDSATADCDYQLPKVSSTHAAMIPQTTQHVLEFIFPDRPRFTVAVPYSPVVIGRDPLSCSVVIDEPIVSKQHIQLHFCADKIVFAEDLGSANGTFLVVEGCRVKLDPLKHYQLLYDQHLELGAEGKMSLRVARRGAQPRANQLQCPIISSCDGIYADGTIVSLPRK